MANETGAVWGCFAAVYPHGLSWPLSLPESTRSITPEVSRPFPGRLSTDVRYPFTHSANLSLHEPVHGMACDNSPSSNSHGVPTVRYSARH